MKKLALIFVSLFLLVSFAAAEVTVQDYTFTIERDSSDSSTQLVSNDNSDTVTIDFSSTLLETTGGDQLSGATFNPAQVVINGVATADLEVSVSASLNSAPGVYTGSIEYDADNGSDVVAGTSTITVTVTNEAPAITAIADESIIVGTAYTKQVSATDAENDDLTYTLTQAPAGAIIDSNGFISGWNAVVAGAYTFTVDVNDGYESSVETFIVTVQNDVPELSLGADDILFGGVGATRGNTIIETVEVKNTGVQQVTNFQASLVSNGNVALNSEYNPSVSVSASSLAPGASAIATISITIPVDQDSKKVTIGQIKVTGDGVATTTTASADLDMQAKSYLRIKDVEIDVEGDDKNIDDGDNYNDIKEGDRVTLRVKVENLYSNDDEIEIENVYVQVEADENDWDIDEESDEKDIKEDDDYEFEIDFTIDDNIDDDETDVTIRVYGDDQEENFEHYDELTFSFEIDRERNEISIISTNFNKQSYSCSDAYAELDVRLKNTGTDDQDEVTLQLVSDDLDWHKRILDMEMDEGDSETETFRIDLSEAEGTEEYFVDIEVYYDGDEETDTETAYFTYSCGGANTGTDDSDRPSVPDGAYRPDQPVDSGNTVVVIAPSDDTATGNNGNVVYGKPIGALDDFRNSNLYIVLLIAVIVFIIAGIFLLGRSLSNK